MLPTILARCHAQPVPSRHLCAPSRSPIGPSPLEKCLCLQSTGLQRNKEAPLEALLIRHRTVAGQRSTAHCTAPPAEPAASSSRSAAYFATSHKTPARRPPPAGALSVPAFASHPAMKSLFDRLLHKALTSPSPSSPSSSVPPPLPPPPPPPSVALLFTLERARLLSSLPSTSPIPNLSRSPLASPFSVYTPSRARSPRCTPRCHVCRLERALRLRHRPSRLPSISRTRPRYCLRGLTCPHCGVRGFLNRHAVLKHVTLVALRGPGREALIRRPRLLRAFWTGIMAVRERGARVPLQVVAVAVKREFGVRKFDIAAVYPRVVVLGRPAWMSVANVSRAFPRVWPWHGVGVEMCVGRGMRGGRELMGEGTEVDDSALHGREGRRGPHAQLK